MNLAEPDKLPLRDIHLPEPVSWWPPAPGWWALAALVLMALIGLTAWWWRQRRYAQRHQALAELAALREALAQSSDHHACAAGLSRLARRVAVAGSGDQSAATTGEAWLRVLETPGGQTFDQDQRRALLEAPYSPRAAAEIPGDCYRGLIDHLEQWVRSVPVHSGAKRGA